jgi:hypothetical protein
VKKERDTGKAHVHEVYLDLETYLYTLD